MQGRNKKPSRHNNVPIRYIKYTPCSSVSLLYAAIQRRGVHTVMDRNFVCLWRRHNCNWSLPFCADFRRIATRGGRGSRRTVHTNKHGRMNHKDTKPYMSAFLSVDLLTDFEAFCLTDFIDWRYNHLWFVFSTQLVNCCPHGQRNYIILVYCCPSTVPSLWPPPSPLLPNVQYIQTVCDFGGGGGGV